MAKRKSTGFSQFAESAARNPLFNTSSDLPRIVEIALSAIDQNPDQPRQHFDTERLSELAASIEQNGLIQPIIVAASPVGLDGDISDVRYALVAGERRYRAFQQLGREAIPAIITSGNPDVIALIENVQREELTPLEEATAYKRLMDQHRYDQTQLGTMVGKKQSTISETLSLLKLGKQAQNVYRTSDTSKSPLSKSVLVEIAKEPSKKKQAELMQAARDQGLSVRALRQRRNTAASSSSAKPAPLAKRSKSDSDQPGAQGSDVPHTASQDSPVLEMDNAITSMEEAMNRVEGLLNSVDPGALSKTLSGSTASDRLQHLSNRSIANAEKLVYLSIKSVPNRD